MTIIYYLGIFSHFDANWLVGGFLISNRADLVQFYEYIIINAAYWAA